MTREEAVRRLNFINDMVREIGSGCFDEEEGHWQADSILLEVLRSIGYDDVADAWVSIPKSYS